MMDCKYIHEIRNLIKCNNMIIAADAWSKCGNMTIPNG